MRTFIVFSLFIISGYIAIAQTEEQWDVYMAMYEKGPGSTTINMGIVNQAPVKNLPYVLVTGLTAKDCRDDGFPAREEFDLMYRASDQVLAEVAKLAKAEHVGTFTYQCKRLDYIYLSDTTQIREQLVKLYKSDFSNYQYHIHLRSDAEWEIYLQYLFPSEEIQEYMSNDKVIIKLSEAGDKLSTARQVDHWLYFSTAKDRDAFERAIKTDGFKTEGKEKLEGAGNVYQLKISRTDKVDHESINPITLALRKKAKEFNGDYDGWETFIVKDK